MAKKQQKQKQKITLKELMRELGINTAACRECTTKNDVESLVTAVFNGIVDAIAADRTVKIHGFGVYSPKTYKGRTQRSGLPGVKDGVATFGDVKLMKFKLSPMAKSVIAGEPRKVREAPEEKPAKPAKAPKAAKVADPGTAVAKSATGPDGAQAQNAVVKPSRGRGAATALAKPEDSHSSPTVTPPADAVPTPSDAANAERSLVAGAGAPLPVKPAGK